MSKFKAGDEIVFIAKHAELDDRRVGDRKTVIKSRKGSGSTVVHYTGRLGEETWSPEIYWELYNPNLEAIKLLEAEGYTVTPPKPKLTGTIFIGVSDDGTVVYSNNSWDVGAYGTRYRNIAVLPWTEGDGLETA